MKKLKLNPEALKVESFDTDGDGSGVRGTVLAHAPYSYVCASVPECNTIWSCEGVRTGCEWACSPMTPGVTCTCV